LVLALVAAAHAGTDATRDSLDRLQEILDLRVEDGQLNRSEVVPALLVSVQPHWEESQGWFAARAIEVLEHAFGAGNLRLCEACMAPRAFVGDGNLVYQTGPVALDEVVRLDDQARGNAQPARSAIWLDEHRGGVAIRIVDLRTARVLFAQNVDPFLVENANSERMYTLSEELERRARGDSLTQAFVDFALYPGQHVSLDWTEQWGPTNANLSGVTLSAYDPVIGLGACHYRRIELLNTLIGAKLLVSLPTAVVRIAGEADVIDPLLTAVALTRVPFGRSNYGAILTVSTNGEVGIGISLMNIRLLPVIP
jgi:hypothetical protein